MITIATGSQKYINKLYNIFIEEGLKNFTSYTNDYKIYKIIIDDDKIDAKLFFDILDFL